MALQFYREIEDFPACLLACPVRSCVVIRVSRSEVDGAGDVVGAVAGGS